MTKILESIEKYTLYIIVVLFPVFVLSTASSPFVVPREAFLAFGLSLVIFLWLIRSVLKGSLTFSTGKFDLPILILMIVYLTSSLVSTQNKMEAFLLPGTTTFILAGGILYFFLNQIKKTERKEGIAFSFLISGVLLSIAVIFAKTGTFAKIPTGLPDFVKDASFNPAGGDIPSIIYLLATFPLLIGLFLKQKDTVKRLFVGVSGVIILLSLALSIKDVLPGSKLSPRLIGLGDSWQITAETLKQQPLLGVGPANFLTAFNKFRPLSYNQTDLWPVKFTTARNFYFTLIAETGLAGAFALVLLFIFIYKSKPALWEKISLLVLLITLALVPSSPVTTVLIFVLLSLSSEVSEKTVSQLRTPVIIFSAPFLAGIVLFSFFGAKAVLAEYKFKKSLDGLTANNAKVTYDNLREAVRINPYVDRYHAAYAQVDMALANSIAAKKDLTDDDKKTISQLISQSINEGKITVNLNPQRSGNWEVLAQIYRSIMPFAQGADQFAVQTYTQAVALDPVNPNLRIALGGIYYALGRYDEAIDTFKLAVLTKGDLANAHYNLAIAYREKKDFTKATEEMNTVLSLVGKDSAHYETALKELKNLESLTPPQTTKKSNITPPLELPENATPPTQP